MSETTFIYLLQDPQNSRKGYVGKADEPRTRLSRHLTDARKKKPTLKRNWIKSLSGRGLSPSLEIIDEVPFEHWPQLEVAYIEFFREQGYELVNGTFGGDCPPSSKGKITSPEVCAKLSAAKKGERHHYFGKKRPLEDCAAISAGRIGIVFPPTQRAAMSAARLGVKHSRNTSGFVGVSWNKAACKWHAVFGIPGKSIFVGEFSKLEDAVFARALALDNRLTNRRNNST